MHIALRRSYMRCIANARLRIKVDWTRRSFDGHGYWGWCVSLRQASANVLAESYAQDAASQVPSPVAELCACDCVVGSTRPLFLIRNDTVFLSQDSQVPKMKEQFDSNKQFPTLLNDARSKQGWGLGQPSASSSNAAPKPPASRDFDSHNHGNGSGLRTLELERNVFDRRQRLEDRYSLN